MGYTNHIRIIGQYFNDILIRIPVMENHGAIYSTRLSMDDSNEKVILTMTFSAKPATIASKLFSLIGFMFNGTMRKMLQKDLTDIRRVAENTC